MRIDKETQKYEREKRQNKNTVGINDRRGKFQIQPIFNNCKREIPKFH